MVCRVLLEGVLIIAILAIIFSVVLECFQDALRYVGVVDIGVAGDVVPIDAKAVPVLFPLVVVADSATRRRQVENRSDTFCSDVLKSCSLTRIPLPLLCLVVEHTESLTRRVLATVFSTFFAEENTTAVALMEVPAYAEVAAPPRVSVRAAVVRLRQPREKTEQQQHAHRPSIHALK